MTAFAVASHAPSRKTQLIWATLVVVLIGIAFVSLSVGRFEVPMDHILGILLHRWLPIDGDWAGVEQRVVELIRMPRLLLAALVGAGLSLCGAALQGALRNPLVGPQIIGVSSGAALGGALAIFFALGTLAVVGNAFLFGVLATAAAYALARAGGRSSVLMLVLAGVVVSAFCASMVSLVTYFANPEDSLPAIVYWLMGSFATASYTKVGIVALALLLAGVPLLLLRFQINILSLGDEEAEALGLNVERLRWLVLTLVAALVAASVSVCGIVDWVGLVIPHFARMLFGPDHRVVLPASMLIGASYMMLIDILARTLTAAEIPLGVLTAVVGAPVFAWLLRRTRATSW